MRSLSSAIGPLTSVITHAKFNENISSNEKCFHTIALFINEQLLGGRITRAKFHAKSISQKLEDYRQKYNYSETAKSETNIVQKLSLSDKSFL